MNSLGNDGLLIFGVRSFLAMNPDLNEGDSGRVDSDGRSPADGVKYREVRYEHTPNLPQILEQLGVALLVSTYQAGKVLVLGAHQGSLRISFMHFDRAMGVAAAEDRIAIGTRRQIHFLQSAPEIAPRIEPANSHDGCFAMRSSFYTGNIHGHDLAWGAEGLWIVNTLFSTLCTLDEAFHFIPRWRPRFVTELADQDRCHLNGLALERGVPRFVSALAETNEPAGWRVHKAQTGCIIDVPTQEVVMRGLAMPHSPRMYQGSLWVLDSGNGDFGSVDLGEGRFHQVERLPGYTRGLAFAGQFAFVGLSKIRETAIFGGLPVCERGEVLRCGVGVVDLITGKTVAVFQFHSGVEEIFAVEVLQGYRNPAVFGPADDQNDDQQEVWIVPLPSESQRQTVLKLPIYSRPKGDSSRAHPVNKPQKTADQYAAIGVNLHRQGRFSEASEAFQNAIVMSPRASTLVDLGNLRQDQGDQQAAIACYRQAVELDANCVPARQNLGYLLMNHGAPEEAVAQYEELLRISPLPMNRLLHALALPVLYDSKEDVDRWRLRIESLLEKMIDDGIVVDTTESLIPTTFFLAYQGKNDRRVMERMGKVIRGKQSIAKKGAEAESLSSNRKVRVGFLSAYFRDHTIGRLNLGRIRHLDRSQFDVIIFTTSRQTDPFVEAFQSSADRFVCLTRDVATSREAIVSEKLDLLLFADVGMDALASTLAYSRMAPIQCVTWGHPDTTGSPNMDYFLSSELLETSEADLHYSEKLIRMPLLGVHYERPRRTGPDRCRSYFGLSEDSHLYVCPQTLFKFHPDFDEILSGILNTDPRGQLVMIEGRVPQWTERLQRRWQRTLGKDAASRVVWIPAQPRDDFMALFQVADVVLDPVHFGGGNSTYEALAMGTPVVSLPGEFLRSRITAALYRKMREMTCIVSSPQQYIELSVRIASDHGFRSELRSRIQSRSNLLFEDPAEVQVFADTLKQLVRGSS
jgi:protein O-GlcNAc transferase